MTSHAECGSVWEVQCSSHNIMVHRGRVAAEIFMNSTVTYGGSCDCVYCTPSAYELNRPLARKLEHVWNVGDITSSCAFVAKENECSICRFQTWPEDRGYTVCSNDAIIFNCVNW